MISGRGMVGCLSGRQAEAAGQCKFLATLLCMTMTPTDRGRRLDRHDIWRLGQATIRRQRHLSCASPAPGGESGSLRAEQGCKRILPLELRWYLQAAIQWAHTSHLTAVSNAHAARSFTR